jgi:PAS domain S-box-containing protein
MAIVRPVDTENEVRTPFAGDLLGSIIEAWDGMIYVTGPDLRIRYLNRRFIDALGRDAIGAFCFQALHGREEACSWCPREVFSGASVTGLFQQPLDGRWYHVSNVPLPLADGTFAKVAFIHQQLDPDALVRDLPVFRNVVDRLSAAVFFHAPESGRLLYVNDLACHSLGYSREDLLTMRPDDYADLPASCRVWADLVRRVENEGVAVFEARHRHRNGSCFDVEVKATLARAGLQSFMVTVARDISERKRAEACLVEERNKVEAIIAATGDAITVQDRDLRIIYQNEVLIRRRGQHLGEYCYQVYAHRDTVCEDCQAHKCFADGQVHRRPYTPATAPGEEPLHLEITASPLHDASGRIVACVEVLRNVTDQRKLEKSREEAFSAVSHEMRTPLTAVLGFAQFMQENPTTPAERQDYLGLILKEGERLKRLIDNLLNLQRLRAGFGLLNPGPVWLYPLLFEAAQHFRSPLAQREIEIDCAPDLPPVLGEAFKLQEAVANLLDNAVKYSPAGSTVVLGAQRDGSRVVVWVRDQGPGIPLGEQERIFERFYRLEGQGKPAGTGLGLALVEEIAYAHRGQVWVKSAPREGSTFYLRLPLAPERRSLQRGT